ncbi:hypothetical protein [Streptomyces sp. NPDC047315]|uniref:hypothetical protein n=1 Tax=Streptomyces sp. NPDC047315 TaxID=3155142 RepID=UPI0033CD06A1
MKTYALTMRVQADRDVGPERISEEIYDRCSDVRFGFDITAVQEVEGVNPTFLDRIYDSLVHFNKTNHWDALRLAPMRHHLAEHLASDLQNYYRTEIFTEAIEAARDEYLNDDTGTLADEAFNQAVSDVVAAIRARLEGK